VKEEVFTPFDDPTRVARQPISSVPSNLPAKPVQLISQRLDPNMSTLLSTKSSTAQHYQKLAVTLITAAIKKPLHKVMVASAHGREGRTTVMLNLAAALGRLNRKVLVVDCDFARPAVSRFLGIETDLCFAKAMLQTQSPWNALLRIEPAGFWVLPSSDSFAGAVEIVSSNGFSNMLQLAVSHFDFVLLDSSPMLEAAHSHLLAQLTDTVLLVVRSGATSPLEMKRALGQLSQEDIIGVVLNRVGD
jgi:Mrp family chromosome partitioning ATPase